VDAFDAFACYGSHIRFVQVRSSPTIHIKRRGYDVFISFRDEEKTRALYNELMRLYVSLYLVPFVVVDLLTLLAILSEQRL